MSPNNQAICILHQYEGVNAVVRSHLKRQAVHKQYVNSVLGNFEGKVPYMMNKLVSTGLCVHAFTSKPLEYYNI